LHAIGKNNPLDSRAARLKAAKVTPIPTLTLFSRDNQFDSILKEVKSYSDVHGQIMFGSDVGQLTDYPAPYSSHICVASWP
jgi:hypothetical protein